jgi:hypothetical protein
MNHPHPAATPIARPLPLHYSRLLRLVLLLVSGTILLPGCALRQTSSKFTALRASTYRGETLAEYIARGPIRPVEGGYRIHAVERRSGAPFSQLTKYPYGWDTTVLGPRIHHWRTTKPAWLAEWEDGQLEGLAK